MTAQHDNSGQAGALIAVAIAYAAACGVMLAPIFNFRHMSTAIYTGDARLVAWALAWDNHALASARSLFAANIFYPTPDALAYGEHFFGISLFSLPIFWLTHNATLGYNVVWLLSYMLTAASAHWLTWRLTRDHLASLVAGLAFAFCFFRMHHGHGHLHLLWVFWIPCALIAMERWLATQSWRWVWAFVVIVVLQALSSWYQAVLVFVAASLFMLWLVAIEPALDRRWPWTSRTSIAIATQSVAGAAVALLAVWPFARHYRVLTSGGPTEAAANAADVAAFLVPPENTFIGRWLLQHGMHGPRWIWGELTLYLGWVTLALGVCGAVVALRGANAEARRLRFYIMLGIVALALAAGPSAGEVASNTWGWSPFGLLAHIPGADLFRAPARFAALLTLALAVLAGAACACLHARVGNVGRFVTAAVIPLMLFEFYVVDFPAGVPKPLTIPGVYRTLATLPPGPVVSLPDYASTPHWFNEPDYQMFSTVHWLPIANGYSRGAPSGFAERMQRFSTFPDASALDAIRHDDIRYVVVHAADYVQGPAAVERAMHDSRCRLIGQVNEIYLFEVVR